MRDFRPLLNEWGKAINLFLSDFLSDDDIPRHLEIIASGTLRESRQTICADHPPAVHDALVILSRVLSLYEATDFATDNPDHLTKQDNAITAAVCAMIAAFNFARALDEKAAQPLVKYALKFMEAGKKPRQDALSQVIEKIVSEHHQEKGELPIWKNVLTRLEVLARTRHKVIQEVDDQFIYWQPSNGQEKKTPIAELPNRLTPIRKKFGVIR